MTAEELPESQQNQHLLKLQQLAAQHAQQDVAHKQQQERMPPDLPPALLHLLDTYILGRKLGGGSFGTVRLLRLLTVTLIQSPMRPLIRPSPLSGMHDHPPFLDT